MYNEVQISATFYNYSVHVLNIAYQDKNKLYKNRLNKRIYYKLFSMMQKVNLLINYIMQLWIYKLNFIKLFYISCYFTA